jgi:hypothetical protein
MKTFLAVFFGILAAAAVIAAIVASYFAFQAAEARDAVRRNARVEIQSLKAVHCTPDIADEFYKEGTERFESELDASTLEPDEKLTLKVGFDNAMELTGCGVSAQLRYQDQARVAREKNVAEVRANLKKYEAISRTQREREAAADEVARQHRDGEAWIYSLPSGGDISVDGDLVGQAPFKIKLAPGRHTVRVERLGFKPMEESFSLSPDQVKQITLDMEQM